MNDCGRFRRAKPRRNDYAVGQPIELGRAMTADVTLGNDETAIGSHAAVAPIASNLVGEGGVQSKTSPRQCIERGAGAPVESQETACLAGCRSGHLGTFDHDDVDPAATEVNRPCRRR